MYTGQPETGVVRVDEQPELPENTLFDTEETVTDLGGASKLSGDIATHTGYTFKSLEIGGGERIAFCVSTADPEVELQIGYMDASGTVTYVTVTGNGGSCAFTVSETGTYKLYIFNPSDYNVSGLRLSCNVSNP